MRSESENSSVFAMLISSILGDSEEVLICISSKISDMIYKPQAWDHVPKPPEKQERLCPFLMSHGPRCRFPAEVTDGHPKFSQQLLRTHEGLSIPTFKVRPKNMSHQF